MAIRSFVVRSLFACFLALAAGSVAAPRAMAQHVVTDNEAGKLTLDSLTATPAPVYRHVVAYRAVRSAWSPAARGRTIRGFQAVSYRRAYRQPASWAGRYAATHRRRS